VEKWKMVKSRLENSPDAKAVNIHQYLKRQILLFVPVPIRAHSYNIENIISLDQFSPLNILGHTWCRGCRCRGPPLSDLPPPGRQRMLQGWRTTYAKGKVEGERIRERSMRRSRRRRW
jgi:hypothetical protein